MTPREAWEIAGKVTAVLLLGIVIAGLAIVAIQEAGSQPHLPLVNAAAEPPCAASPSPENPCLYIDCDRPDTKGYV